MRCRCAAGAVTKLRNRSRSWRRTDCGGAFPARLPHQHHLRRLERDHATLHRARSTRSASQSRRRDFQHHPADVHASSRCSLGLILSPLVSAPMDARQCRQPRQTAEHLRPHHAEYTARTSKRLARGLFHAMTRFGPKLDREQLLLSRFVGSPPKSSPSVQPARLRNIRSTAENRPMKSCR